MTLLENARIRLGWVKAHIGIKGNEIADTLAKEATTDGIPASLPFPKSFLKKQLLQLSLSRWQAEWDNGETGRSVYSIIPLTLQGSPAFEISQSLFAVWVAARRIRDRPTNPQGRQHYTENI
ncbi:hypothetical protein AVEN_215229-1 [Araneus ventricosus]|uniref:RNase H type-1 domain-containing protein n=1 Tax=Araneus ventricosus TaxID=182803 RepID=A0A4Y2H7A2_ARAVE|nr:hypothetical protein AVEN_215229-1 [Araneus ventricosus]